MAFTNSQNYITVIGAAGQTGLRIVKWLLKKGASTGVIIHNESQRKKIPIGADTNIADISCLNELVAALQNTNTVYYIPPVFITDEVTFGENVIAAAKSAGVFRLVYHSVMHSATREMPHHWRKHQVELLLKDSGLQWTIVQPAMYSQTPLSFLSANKNAMRIGFSAEKSFTPIDLEDLGEAVAIILTGESYENKTLELAGNDLLNFREMAEIIGHVLGHKVKISRFQSFIVSAIAAMHLRPNAAKTIKAMMDHYDKNGFVSNSHTLEEILGRKPNTFLQTMERELLHQN